MKITAAHEFLTANHILSRKDGWKTLLPKHAFELLNDYKINHEYLEDSRSLEDFTKDCLVRDHGKKIAKVIIDLAWCHVNIPGCNEDTMKALRRSA